MIAPVRQQVPLPQLSARDRGAVTAASLRGEPDFAALPALRAYLSDIRWRGRPDLTGQAFTGAACLGVLVRDSGEIRALGGSFALTGPQGAVRRVLSVTGPITWFEVHDTAGPAARGPRTGRPGRRRGQAGCRQDQGRVQAPLAAWAGTNCPSGAESGSFASRPPRAPAPVRVRHVRAGSAAADPPGQCTCRAGSSPAPGARAGSCLQCQGLLGLGRELDDGGQA
jgi:anti-anti-sigma factor